MGYQGETFGCTSYPPLAPAHPSQLHCHLSFSQMSFKQNDMRSFLVANMPLLILHEASVYSQNHLRTQGQAPEVTHKHS